MEEDLEDLKTVRLAIFLSCVSRYPLKDVHCKRNRQNFNEKISLQGSET